MFLSYLKIYKRNTIFPYILYNHLRQLIKNDIIQGDLKYFTILCDLYQDLKFFVNT